MEVLLYSIGGWIILITVYLISEFKSTRRVRKLVRLFEVPKKLWEHGTVHWMLDRLGLDVAVFKKLDLTDVFKVRKKELLSVMRAAAREHGRDEFRARDLLSALFQVSPQVRAIFDDARIDFDDLQLVSLWWGMEQERVSEGVLSKFSREKPLGYKLLSGYTLTLDEYSRPAKELYDTKRSHFHLHAHHGAMKRLQGALAQTGFNNVLLVGEPGVGKRSVVYALAHAIEEGRARLGLNLRRVMVLDMERLLAGVANKGDVRSVIGKVFHEAERAGNVMLVIENFHEFVDKKRGVSISDIIVPFIRSHSLQVIGLTTPHAFNDVIVRDKQLRESFVDVAITEPTQPETISVLYDVVDDIEERGGVQFQYQALKSLVNLGDRYIGKGKRPQKTITLLDQMIAWVDARQGKNPTVITQTHVESFLSELFGVSISKDDDRAAKKVLGLAKAMKKDVIGQDDAIKAVARALQRRQAALSGEGHTVGNFLFVGPTGVGKTSVAKALARHYFEKRDNAEDPFVYINMTEYSSPSSVAQLIGTRDEPSGVLVDAVQRNPFVLILLDELEKANKEVMNVLLQVLDEGRLINPRQEVVDFRQAIIIATSNAGAQLIHDSVKNKQDINSADMKQGIIDHILKSSVFSPEFLNRFDDTILFHPLDPDDLVKIAKLRLTALAVKMKEEHDIKVTFKKDVIDFVVTEGYTPQFGARQLNRVIQDHVEAALAQMILKKRIKKKSALSISRDMLI